MDGTALNRGELSAAVSGEGWRVILADLCTEVATESLSQAAEAAAALASLDGVTRGPAVPNHRHLRLDVRPDRLVITLAFALVGGSAQPEAAEDARRLSAKLRELGLIPEPARVQGAEIAIDALDIPAVLPFWRAVLGYVNESERSIVDPAGKSPCYWFQQMDEPRPQRNRIHVDITVPHDQARTRIDAALAAGGTIIGDSKAPAFWILADPEGNEACVCTWQARD